MKKKNDRPEIQPNSDGEKKEQFRTLNNVSSGVNDFISGVNGRLRHSLTLQIASHYARQLMRSAFSLILKLFLILLIINCVYIFTNTSRALREGTGRAVQVTELIRAEKREMPRPESTGDWIRLEWDTLKGTDAFPLRMDFIYPAGEEMYCVHTDERVFWLMFCAIAGTVILGDFSRMGYFIHHRKRLNKRVLRPIREITTLAATLGENNLSNRINLAGTKNELRDLATVINTMLDRIENSYNNQKQFVSDASHELRTPIAVIRGYASMLQRWGKDDPEVLGESVDAIAMEADNMKNLVENLLFLARHDKKTLMLEKEEFNVTEVVNEVCHEEEMVASGFTFTNETQAAVLLNADRGMVKQVLRILCDNAVKYSGASREVHLSARKQADQCILSVEDRGIGMTAEELSHAFERFYRGDEARRSEKGGHGLGLSIARVVVVAHGGKITARSKKGFGTEFSVCLPTNIK